jgi:hypothetical protein
LSVHRKHPLAPGISELFESLDRNKDGEVTSLEAQDYVREDIGGLDFDTAKEVQAAGNQMVSALDTSDLGSTISEMELELRLHNVLAGTRTWDWVAHGLGLASYADAFKVGEAWRTCFALHPTWPHHSLNRLTTSLRSTSLF